MILDSILMVNLALFLQAHQAEDLEHALKGEEPPEQRLNMGPLLLLRLSIFLLFFEIFQMVIHHVVDEIPSKLLSENELV